LHGYWFTVVWPFMRLVTGWSHAHTALKERVSVRGDGAWMMGADVCLCS